MSAEWFAGLDIGSSATKAVVIDRDGLILGSSVDKTGISYEKVSRRCFDSALSEAGIDDASSVAVVSTGYGRRSTPITDVMRTEISCLSMGAHFYFPGPLNIIDIGGQDNKMVSKDAEGKVVDFQMNRKCAAGTGAFLEEIANRLDMTIADLHRLAGESKETMVLGSYCTVFTFSEILTHLEKGVDIKDLARGVMFSIVKRIYEFGIQGGDLVLTGGVVEHNHLIAEMLQKEFKVNVLLPPNPQLICALGAALISRELQMVA